MASRATSMQQTGLASLNPDPSANLSSESMRLFRNVEPATCKRVLARGKHLVQLQSPLLSVGILWQYVPLNVTISRMCSP